MKETTYNSYDVSDLSDPHLYRDTKQKIRQLLRRQIVQKEGRQFCFLEFFYAYENNFFLTQK